MFKKFPLFYIAWLYVFSTKDKIVFFMQQFASLVIALCISVLICIFSIMNGFTIQIQNMVSQRNAPIVLISKDGKDLKNTIQNFNEGFVKPDINNLNIKKINYLRKQVSFVFIDSWQKQIMIYEDPNQITPIATNLKSQLNLFSNNLKQNIKVYDPGSYNILIGGFTRFKSYSNLAVNESIVNAKDEGEILIFSSQEYKKLFHNDNYNQIDIYLEDFEDTDKVVDYLKFQTKNIDNLQIKTWKTESPFLFDTLELQKKIFFLVYFIMFILLCAIIVSTNIAFFKEKRKDWALLKIMDIKPLSVERIFLYKNLILFLLSTISGIILGLLITIYSNNIIDFLGVIMNSKINISSIFITQKVSYIFKLNDFIKIIAFSLGIFFVNFVILVIIFRKENIANFLKTQ